MRRRHVKTQTISADWHQDFKAILFQRRNTEDATGLYIIVENGNSLARKATWSI